MKLAEVQSFDSAEKWQVWEVYKEATRKARDSRLSAATRDCYRAARDRLFRRFKELAK